MKLALASSPHIRGGFHTNRIMLDVVIALLPALAAGALVLGVRALLVALVCVAAALITEGIYDLIAHRRSTLPDCSAAVTGLLLAMTLPVSILLWQAAIGGAFAVVVVKSLCGGLGQNIFNPALAARALLMLIWPASLTRYHALGVDGVSTATPLHLMRMPALPDQSLTDMFLGNISGSIGEISALALLIGGAYLLARRVISVRIPAAYLGSVAVLSLIFSKTGNPILWMLYNLLGGGLILGAIFMATDYASSPVTPKGQWIYGIGCGVFTMFFRSFGLFPEGVTYAILLMNACAWLIDRRTAPRRYGSKGGAA